MAETGDLEIARVVQSALRVARKRLTDHPHKFAARKVPQPRLFACLLLKAHLGCAQRKAEEMLLLMPAVRETLGLREVPQLTTLQRFADRPEVPALIDGELASIGRVESRLPQDVTLDNTGMECTSASAHFVSRAARKRTGFVTLILGVPCTMLLQTHYS